MEFSDVIKSRYSCRDISEREVEPEKLQEVLEYILLAPTAKNLQPYKIWTIKSPEGMEKLKQATHFTFGAHMAFVIGGNVNNAFVRPKDGKNFATIDATIIATYALLSITATGLATTWVGMVDEPKLKELFPEMQGFDIVAVFPVGYAAEDAKPSPRHTERKSQEEMVVFK